MPDKPFEKRQERLARRLRDFKVDALLVSALPNIRYLTGFTGSNGLLLVSEGSADFFTDPRYTTQAASQVSGKVRVVHGPLMDAVGKRLKRTGLKRVGFERSRLSYEQFEALQAVIPARSKVRPLGRVVEDLRMIKSRQEIEQIRASVELNSAAFEEASAAISPEIQELEFAAMLDHAQRQRGAEGPAFDTIVAAGARAALPHARPTSAPLGRRGPVLVDMGAMLGGYASDMTRMLHIGTPSKSFLVAYVAVLEAQRAAIDTVQPGVTAGKVDAAARKVLRRQGFDAYFIHSTGHGLGLEIHESPRLGRGDQMKLAEGMAITIEPGVYFEGRFGIRIEDTLVVTKTGGEVLTSTAKELRVSG